MVPNIVTLQKEVCEISAVKNLCSPKKVDQSSPKSLKICYAPMPLTKLNFIARGHKM